MSIKSTLALSIMYPPMLECYLFLLCVIGGGFIRILPHSITWITIKKDHNSQSENLWS
jgi:hypothetical protein